MSESSSRAAHRPERDQRASPPDGLISSKCPACGREPAIVFEIVRCANEQAARPRQVCLVCCPKVGDDC